MPWSCRAWGKRRDNLAAPDPVACPKCIGVCWKKLIFIAHFHSQHIKKIKRPVAVSSSDNSIVFPRGGGEMGQRIRELDWALTPVGPISHWPQSLRSAVSMLLASRFPMFIWWGKEHIQFYNDAYRPSMGNNGKHPSALGQRGEECWPEIWSVIYPLIRQVLDGGDATWREDQLIPIFRNGGLEDVYWTFSYSPLLDESGSIAGVLVVCSENTEKILNFRRLKESEDQLSFAIESAELGTWDYNPLTGKFTSNNRMQGGQQLQRWVERAYFTGNA